MQTALLDNISSSDAQPVKGLRVLGALVGFFSAGLGVGGGAILIPVLVSLYHFEFKRAAGTSLATIIPISLVGAISHVILLKQDLHYLYLFVFVPVCVVGAVLGGAFLKNFNTRYLKLAFALFILISGLKMIGVYDVTAQVFKSFAHVSPVLQIVVIALFGVATGFVATVLGVGCGLVIVPFFVFFVGLNMHETIAISLITVFFLSSTASVVYGKCRTLDKTSVVKMFPSALIGSIVGVLLSSHLSASMLKLLFGVFLLVMAAKFILFDECFAFLKRRWRSKYGYKSVQRPLSEVKGCAQFGDRQE